MNPYEHFTIHSPHASQRYAPFRTSLWTSMGHHNPKTCSPHTGHVTSFNPVLSPLFRFNWVPEMCICLYTCVFHLSWTFIWEKFSTLSLIGINKPMNSLESKQKGEENVILWWVCLLSAAVLYECCFGMYAWRTVFLLYPKGWYIMN